MNIQKIQSAFLAAFFGSCLLVACGDDDDHNHDHTSDAGASDGSVAFVCDPKGQSPEVGDLLNAPLEGDVEVIVKEPQHPGDPGPTNLP